MAPVRLPGGVSVRRFGGTFYDNVTNGDASLTLWRVDTISSLPATLGSVATSLGGATPEIQYLVDTTIANGRIENNRYIVLRHTLHGCRRTHLQRHCPF